MKLPHGSKPLRITHEWFEDYEIRTGKDGKPGIYLRAFHARLATFNCNTTVLQLRLQKLFDRCATPKVGKPKRKAGRLARRLLDVHGGGAFMNDVGDQGYRDVGDNHTVVRRRR